MTEREHGVKWHCRNNWPALNWSDYELNWCHNLLSRASYVPGPLLGIWDSIMKNACFLLSKCSYIQLRIVEKSVRYKKEIRQKGALVTICGRGLENDFTDWVTFKLDFWEDEELHQMQERGPIVDNFPCHKYSWCVWTENLVLVNW